MLVVRWFIIYGYVPMQWDVLLIFKVYREK